MNLNININLNDEQKAFVGSTKQFANEHIKNNSLKWDKSAYFPVEVFKKSAELGLAGIYVPEKDGGTGLTRVDASLIFYQHKLLV